MNDFERMARERWERGVLEHRRQADCFVGDPVMEARSEVLDLWNYAGEARRQQLVGPLRFVLLRALALSAWRLL